VCAVRFGLGSRCSGRRRLRGRLSHGPCLVDSLQMTRHTDACVHRSLSVLLPSVSACLPPSLTLSGCFTVVAFTLFLWPFAAPAPLPIVSCSFLLFLLLRPLSVCLPLPASAPAPLPFVFNRAAYFGVGLNLGLYLLAAGRLAVCCYYSGYDRFLCLVYLCCHRVAGETAPQNERTRYRCQPKGH